MCTLWSLILVKKSCNNINNSRAQVSRLCYSLWLWLKVLNLGVDESLLTWRKNHHGWQLPQQCVFGGVFREAHECFIYTVPDRGVSTLLLIMQGSIGPGTTLMSDLWSVYKGIQAMGYTHLTVNDTYELTDSVTGTHIQNVENSWDKPSHA